MPPEPSHKKIIHRYIDWNKVENRINKFPAIKEFFTIEDLKGFSGKGPYYCHWLAWRLATWENEEFFHFFNYLLSFGKGLKGWNKEKYEEATKDPDWKRFWSLLWELQVANALRNYPDVSEIEWLLSGPDLKATTNRGEFFIECYVYNKSFYLEKFICEILQNIRLRHPRHPRLRISHAIFKKFQLVKKAEEIEPLLNDLFGRFDDDRLAEYEKESETTSPVIIYECQDKNFQVWMDGVDGSNYVPCKIKEMGGTPESYLEHVLKESVPKEKEKQLKDRHPNVLAINLFLSEDFQSACHRHRELKLEFPIPEIPDWLDAVFYTVCGIDRLPQFENGLLKMKNHPLAELLGIKQIRFDVF